MAYIPTLQRKVLSMSAADSSAVVPAGYYIANVLVMNNTGNGILGGLKIGTSNGAADVVLALTVAGNATISIPDSLMLKRFFSRTVDQTIYMDSVIGWNSTNVDVIMWLLPI